LEEKCFVVVFPQTASSVANTGKILFVRITTKLIYPKRTKFNLSEEDEGSWLCLATYTFASMFATSSVTARAVRR
jgi:hypothetical protein